GIRFTCKDLELQTSPPPPPKPTYACVNRNLSSGSIQTGQSVAATVTYSESGGALFQSVNYSWGDGASTTTGTSANHTYTVAGTFTVIATVNFKLPDGSLVSATSATCQGSVMVTSPPPPPQKPSVACTGPQEISGNGSVIVKCDAHDGNGAPISMNAQSQDSNS